MNSRERLLKTIEGKITDRVPVSLFIHDEGNFLMQVYDDLDMNDPLGCKFKLIDFLRELGTDIHLRMIHGMLPKNICYGGLNVESANNWEVSSKEYKHGKTLVKSYEIKTPKRKFYQEFSISEIAPGTVVHNCTKKPIKDLKDLETAIEFEPSLDKEYIKELSSMVIAVKEYLKDDGITSIWAPGGSFNAASSLIDLDILYSIFLTDRSFFEKLMDFCIKRTFPVIEAMCNSGVDVINIGGNVPGGFLGKKIYDEYILPYERKYIDFIKSFGIKTLYHNCGQAMGLIDSYKDLESDIVEPFSPPPLGDGDLKKVKELYGSKFTIIGNIDQINIIKDGTIDLVRKVTRETVEIGKTGGNFILQNADYLDYGTPVENVKAYVETGIAYGRY